MKSNLMELFNEYMEKNSRKIIDVNEMVDEFYPLFISDGSNEFFRKEYLKDRIETLLNNNNCYSFNKNKFILLDIANIKQLIDMESSFKEAIQGREKTLARIREQEEIKGQMRINPDGSIEEEKSITDLIGEAVGT